PRDRGRHLHAPRLPWRVRAALWDRRAAARDRLHPAQRPVLQPRPLAHPGACALHGGPSRPCLARRPTRTALALRERHELTLVVARVDLARARDLLLGVGEALLPLRKPTGQPPEREEHREIDGRIADRLVD